MLNDYEEMYQNAKQQIEAHIEQGIVPADVVNFSELHCYVDANDYGIPDDFEVCFDVLNDLEELQNRLDRWIRNGRSEEGVESHA